MAEEHKFATKLREKQELADQGDVKAQKYLDSGAAQVLRDYLDPDPITGAGGVPDTRGGGLGAIRENDPVLSAGSEAAQLERENLLYSQGKRRGNLTAEDIKGINIDLVREGMTPDDYFRFNQMLYSPNIEEYQKARPISSGKSLRDIITMATPAKYIKSAAETIGRTVLDAPSDFMDSAMVEGITDTWKGRKKGEGFKGLINNVLQMTGIGTTDQAKKFTEDKVTENIQVDETDQGEDIDVSLATIKETNKNKTEDLNLMALQDKTITSFDIDGVKDYIADVSSGIQVASAPDNLKETWDFMVANNMIKDSSEYLVGNDIINQPPVLYPQLMAKAPDVLNPAGTGVQGSAIPLNYDLVNTLDPLSQADQSQMRNLADKNISAPAWMGGENVSGDIIDTMKFQPVSNAAHYPLNFNNQPLK